MNRVFILILTSILICSCKIDGEESRFSLYGVSKMPKIIETNVFDYYYEPDSIVKSRLTYSSKTFFSSDGKIDSAVYYNPMKDEKEVYVTTYNDFGKKSKEFSKGSEKTVLVEYIYRDSILDKVISNSSFETISGLSEENYFYDSVGRLDSTIVIYTFILDGKDTVLSSSKTIYDYNKLPIYIDYQFEDDTLFNNYTEYDINNEGRILSEIQHDIDIKKTITFTYKEDNFGSWILKEGYDKGVLISKTERKIKYRNFWYNLFK